MLFPQYILGRLFSVAEAVVEMLPIVKAIIEAAEVRAGGVGKVILMVILKSSVTS